MSKTFSMVRIMDAIESEIPYTMLGDCIVWCDHEYANGYSEAINYLEEALNLKIAGEINEEELLHRGNNYLDCIIPMIQTYKRKNNISDEQTFTRLQEERIDHAEHRMH